jgi:peptidyl-dipeptidase Dcp
MSTNPFFTKSTLEYELPPFELINETHYLEAFYAGVKEQLLEIDTILASPEVSFENTIEAMERSGAILSRVLNVFYNKSSSDTNDQIDAIEAEIAPKLAAHSDAIRLNPQLFARVKNLRENSTDLNEEQAWLVERYFRDFAYAGAELSEASRNRVKQINEELSSLQTQFSKKLLADTNDLAFVVENEKDLDGLTPNQIAACKAAAESRGLPDKWLITMMNFTGHPLLSSLTNRALREKVMKNSLLKGDQNNDNDTKEVLLSTVKLRTERAKLFGVKTHAEFVLQEQTAANPANVHAMLKKLAPAAVKNAQREGQDIQEIISREANSYELASWDWDFYTEKVRAEKYSLDTSAMKPYFELESVLKNGVFFAAQKLYGLTFKERPDLIAYHPEARVFEVFNEDGSAVGLYIGDFYTRDSKRGGAWMNSLVRQNRLLNQKPVVLNNMNISKPPKGEVTLLSYSETTTLFHEFGHAIHGLLSDVTYPRVSGTAVQRDFVEFPSQVNEMWILWPEVLDNYAIHYQTGERLPQAWVEKLNESSTFNEGHATTSYLAAAILDLAWHSIEDTSNVTSVTEFEANAIKEYGLQYEPVPTRYRSTYFSHIFAGGYSAGYYGYIWSEVLDADTVEWFKDNGGLTRKNGDHFRNTLMSRGGSVDSMQMFRNFRGRDAQIDPLLRRRGLIVS